MTNAEKIKNMSKEELAILLISIQVPYLDTPFCEHPCNHSCRDCIRKWLDKETEENV